MPTKRPSSPRQPANHPVGFFGTDLDSLIEEAGIVDAGDDCGGEVFQPLQTMEGGIGLHGDDANAGVLLLQISGDAGEGAGRAQTSDKMRNLAPGLLKDLWSGCLVMRSPVGGIVVLVGVEVSLGLLAGKISGNADCSIRTFERVGEDQLGAKKTQDFNALWAGVGWQSECDPNTPGCTKGRISDAHIAGGRVPASVFHGIMNRRQGQCAGY